MDNYCYSHSVFRNARRNHIPLVFTFSMVMVRVGIIQTIQPDIGSKKVQLGKNTKTLPDFQQGFLCLSKLCYVSIYTIWMDKVTPFHQNMSKFTNRGNTGKTHSKPAG